MWCHTECSQSSTPVGGLGNQKTGWVPMEAVTSGWKMRPFPGKAVTWSIQEMIQTKPGLRRGLAWSSPGQPVSAVRAEGPKRGRGSQTRGQDLGEWWQDGGKCRARWRVGSQALGCENRGRVAEMCGDRLASIKWPGARQLVICPEWKGRGGPKQAAWVQVVLEGTQNPLWVGGLLDDPCIFF